MKTVSKKIIAWFMAGIMLITMFSSLGISATAALAGNNTNKLKQVVQAWSTSGETSSAYYTVRTTSTNTTYEAREIIDSTSGGYIYLIARYAASLANSLIDTSTNGKNDPEDIVNRILARLGAYNTNASLRNILNTILYRPAGWVYTSNSPGLLLGSLDTSGSWAITVSRTGRQIASSPEYDGNANAPKYANGTITITNNDYISHRGGYAFLKVWQTYANKYSITESNPVMLDFSNSGKNDSITTVTTIQGESKKTYYGGNTAVATKAGDVKAAVTVFYNALTDYYNAFYNEGQKTIGDKNSLVNLDNLAQQLKTQDAATADRYITMIDQNVPNDCMNSVYYALASFLSTTVNNNVDLGSINFKKDSITNAMKIVTAVRKGMSGSGKTTIKHGNYEITFDTTNMWGSFTGKITATQIKGNGKGRVYSGAINSTVKRTEEVLSTYLDCMQNIVKDACKYALFSIFSELRNVTGIAAFEKEELTNFLSDKVDILQKKGFGNVLTLLVNVRDGYNAVKKISQATTGTNLINVLKNAGSSTYNTIKGLSFSPDKVKKKAIKEALTVLETARAKLATALFNYVYNAEEVYEEKRPSFWDNILNFFSFKCPVEFEIYDADGNLIGYVDSTDKHEDYIYYTDDIYIEVDGDAKFVYAPADKELRFFIIATDDGEMNYTVERIDKEEKVDRLNYYSVPLVAGETYEQIIPKNVILADSMNALPLINDDTAIYADEYRSGADETAHVTISCESTPGGIALGGAAYALGDFVKLYAIEESDAIRFAGWYLNDELVCTDRVYRFTATEDLTVVAAFEKYIDRDNEYEIALGDNYADTLVDVYTDADSIKYVELFGELDADILQTVSIIGYSQSNAQIYTEDIAVTYNDDYDAWLNALDVTDCKILELFDSSGALIATLIKGKTVDTVIQDILLDETEMMLEIGDTATIPSIIVPYTAPRTNTEWISDNTAVVTVGKDGTVTAVSAGKANIIIRDKGNSNVSTVCRITVQDTEPQSPDTPSTPSDACKFCGKVHTGFFGKLVQFFHNIFYFFKNLFK